jgi:hypothetical protein
MKPNLGRIASGALLFAGFLLTFAGCSNGSSQSPSPGPSSPAGCGTATANTRVYATAGTLTSSSNPTNNPNAIFVFTQNSILNATASVAPCAQVAGPTFTSAFGLALDSSANMYITDQASNTVQVFGAGTNGTSVTPLRTISSTNLGAPYGIALDGAGNLYVSAQGTGTTSNPNGAIFVFPATSSGNVNPTRVIAGSKTGLDLPAGLAISGQTLYVTNQGSSTVETFGLNANGNVSPLRTISGSSSGLNAPVGATVRGGFIYVSNHGTASSSPGSITVYNATGTSSLPVRTITSASSAGLFGPAGLAIDGSSRLWVGEAGPPTTSSNPSGTLAVYPAGANGSVSPTAAVSGVGFATWAVAVF